MSVCAIERFWALTDRCGPDECWLWLGAIDADGYGHFTERSYVTGTAHRFSWRIQRGDVPEGLTLDHTCRTRNCVNPDHLDPVPNVVNVMRGEGAPARNARKTHCDRGHLLGGENLRPRRDGRRVCVTCSRDYHRDYMRARRATV